MKASFDVPVILIDDPHAANQPDIPEDLNIHRYTDLLKAEVAKTDYLAAVVENELQPLAVNFTSGTSGKPKGVDDDCDGGQSDLCACHYSKCCV